MLIFSKNVIVKGGFLLGKDLGYAGGGEGEEQLSVSERTGNGPTEFGIWGGRGGGIQHILTSASRLESYCCLPF